MDGAVTDQVIVICLPTNSFATAPTTASLTITQQNMAANTIAWEGKAISPLLQPLTTETRAPIHRGEKLLTPGYGTDIELKIPATIQGPKRTERSWGRIWLTDQRVGRRTTVSNGSKLMADHLHRTPKARRRGPERTTAQCRAADHSLAHHSLRTSADSHSTRAMVSSWNRVAASCRGPSA